MQTITQVVVIAGALLLSAYVVPGIEVTSVWVAIIAAIVLGLLNLIIRPILFVLTLPITIVTFGLFAVVLNALMFMLAASFLEGFNVDGFLPALIGSIIVSIAGALISEKD